MSRYWTERVQQLAPYVPGEQPQDQPYIKLNTNENPYPPSPRVAEALTAFDSGRLRLYPDPESSRLRQALADRHGVAPAQVFVGNGSDEVLAHSFQAFFQRPQPLLFPEISYSFYPVYCQLYGIEAKRVPLREDFRIGVEDYEGDCAGVILPNPNAPTSRLLSLQEIERLCALQPDRVVIIDEAYIDFGGESAIRLLDLHPNLLVIQTFSKSRSLAGIRLGVAIGSEELIEGLQRVKNSFNSYPIDSLAQTLALASLEDEDYFRESCQRIVATREQSRKALEQLGFRVLPSAANFLFARPPAGNAGELYRQLKQRGILVRHFNQPGIDQWLRITVGKDEEMGALLETLDQLGSVAK